MFQYFFIILFFFKVHRAGLVFEEIIKLYSVSVYG